MNKKLCIVVPYRDREQHLEQFIPRMKNFLDPTGIEYDILIVEQESGKAFNRAKLLNVGFDYTKGSYDYYVFHDVDMLPIEADYSYCDHPTHLAGKAEQFGWTLPYYSYFGGVTMFDTESFIKINGYANEYWGWGAEDDDIFNRCNHNKLKISRKECSYNSLAHSRNIVETEYNRNVEILNGWLDRAETDGLNSLIYTLKEEQDLSDYKKILVEI